MPLLLQLIVIERYATVLGTRRCVYIYIKPSLESPHPTGFGEGTSLAKLRDGFQCIRRRIPIVVIRVCICTFYSLYIYIYIF